MADIAWLIPGLIHGSGGHRTILQHAHALEQKGHRCFIYIGGVGKPADAITAIVRMFGYQFQHASFGWDNIAPADLVFATIWHSAGVVSALPFPCKKAYFVQDYEAMFSAMGDSYLLAENSYRYGLLPITIGRWLQHVLAIKYQTPAWHIDFGADTSVYHPLPDAHKENAICFIYQPDKPRRCAYIGLNALALVKQQRPDITIYLYGSPVRASAPIAFEHHHLGLLDLAACNALYNRCMVGLCLSASNPSRIPFEMMAAGLPVVELWRENNVYDFNDDIIRLSLPTPDSLAACIIDLIDHPQQRKRMSTTAMQWMQHRSLSAESDQFIAAVDAMLNDQPHQLPTASSLAPTYHGSAFEHPVHVRQSDVNDLINMAYSRRLAFLPPPLRRLLSQCKHALRRLIST